MWWVPAAMIASQVAGGIAGKEAARESQNAANDALQQAFNQLSGLNIPDVEKMKLALQMPEVQGTLQPYLQQAEQLGPSALEEIAIDPRLKQIQMEKLELLSKIGSEGLTAEDRANLNAMRRQVAADEQSRQQSILQQMAQRGVGGSGMELASRIASSQAQADRASQESDRIGAMALRRALEGVAQSGSLAGNIRQQEYGEQLNAKRAKDLNEQFNLSQRAGVSAANIAAMNAAQQANLMNKQRIHEAAVGLRNQEQQYNKQLLQQKFENDMALRQARAAALAGQAQSAMQRANQTAGQWMAGAGAVAEGLGAYAGYQNSAADRKLSQDRIQLDRDKFEFDKQLFAQQEPYSAPGYTYPWQRK